MQIHAAGRSLRRLFLCRLSPLDLRILGRVSFHQATSCMWRYMWSGRIPSPKGRCQFAVPGRLVRELLGPNLHVRGPAMARATCSFALPWKAQALGTPTCTVCPHTCQPPLCRAIWALWSPASRSRCSARVVLAPCGSGLAGAAPPTQEESSHTGSRWFRLRLCGSRASYVAGPLCSCPFGRNQ